MTKKIVGQWAVWQHVLYPWFQTGEVDGFDQDYYFVKEYGSLLKKHCVLISNEQGRKLKEDHDDLYRINQKVLNGLMEGMNSILRERLRKIDPAIISILPPRPAGKKRKASDGC